MVFNFDYIEQTGKTSDMRRVGRWMSEDEYAKMISSGYVQENYSSTTHVAKPASHEAYLKQTKPGNVYIEFDALTSSLKRYKMDGQKS